MISNHHKKNYYEILGVQPFDPPDKIQMAYLDAKKAYSPSNSTVGTIFSKKEIQQLFTLIEEAYATLSDQTKRVNYDLQLKKEETSDRPPISIQRFPNTIPKGFGRTKFGVYEILPAIEKEIEKGPIFDGHFIRKVRLYKNIDLRQMSQATRISRMYLFSIESNDFEFLPAAIFVKGFIIQIAKVLNLDHEKVADGYMKHFKDGFR